MGFIHDIRKIVALLPRATPEPAVLARRSRTRSGELAREFLTRSRRSSQVAPRNATADSRRPRSSTRSTVERKADLLLHLVRRDGIGAGPRIHPDQDRRQPPRLVPGPARRRRRSPSTRDRTQGERTRALGGLQAGRGHLPGGDRYRVARARHRRDPLRRELRGAVQGPGLHPPDRPDRSGRPERRRRSRWCARTRPTCSGRSSACSRCRSRSRWWRASSRTGRWSPTGRSGGSAATAAATAATTPITSRSASARPRVAAARASPAGRSWSNRATSGRTSTPFWFSRTAIATPVVRQVAQLAAGPQAGGRCGPAPGGR